MGNRSDNFNRADGSLGTPSDGGSAWESISNISISSNQASAGGTLAFAALEASTNRVDVQVTLTSIPVGSSQGAVARAADDGNFFLASVRPDQDAVSLNRWESGFGLAPSAQGQK